MEATGGSTLRAKYLDWCSARLAERFLDLSPEEIYALARPEAQGKAGDIVAGEEDSPAVSPDPGDAEPGAPPQSALPRRPAGQGPSLPRPTDEGYRVLVQRVTEALLRRTSLPTFDQWSEAYAEAPDRFDAELLGFWKDAVPESDAAGSGGEAEEG